MRVCNPVRPLVVAPLAFALLAACTGGSAGSPSDTDTDTDTNVTDTDTDTGTDGSTLNGLLLPDPAGVTFVSGVDNPYFPLPVGATWVYDVPSSGEHVEVTVTADTKVISGVTAVVVRDVGSVDGEVLEDTFDWFAQDSDGNVWYLGEETCEYEDGVCVDTHGSWEWGVDGALPGVVMWADPTITGQRYYQEYLAGEAEDAGEVTGFDPVDLPLASWTDCVTTNDTSTVELSVSEYKHYCRGIGLVLTDPDEALTSSSLAP